MGKKKILIIDGPLGGGGAERVLIDILNHFDYDKYEVDLALICKKGVLLNQIPAEVNVIGLWPDYNLHYKAAFRMSKWLHCNYLFSRVMNSKKLRKNYDVEISFLEGMPLKLHALRKTKAKHISWVHADLLNFPYEKHQFFNGEELKAYNKMNEIVHVSGASMDAFKQRFTECKTRQRVIYNPVDIDKIVKLSEAKNIKRADDKFTIIGIGRVTHVKRIDIFLQVAKLSVEKGYDFKFLWIGDGDMLNQMIQLRDSLNLIDRVDFKGFCKNPYPFLKQADCLIQTSDSESFGMVLAEAMALKIPVISTRTTGAVELCGNNEAGLICDHTPESIMPALEKIYRDKDEYYKLQQNGEKRVIDFSINSTMAKIESLF